MGDNTQSDGVRSGISPFWGDTFPSVGLVKGVSDSHSNLLKQLLQLQNEGIGFASVSTTPLYSRELLLKVELQQTEMSVGPLPLSYGAGAEYGEQTEESAFREGEIFEYGGAEKLTPYFYFALPEDFVSCGPAATDQINRPTLTLTSGQDFLIVDSRIIAFSENPFLSGSKLNSIVDEEGKVSIWLQNVFFDRNYLHQQFGYPIVEGIKSSESLRDRIRTLMALYSGGPTLNGIDGFIAAAAGKPVTSEVEEVVELIGSYGGKTFVATNVEVYQIDDRDTLRSHVVPGARLLPRSPLVTASSVEDLNSDPNWWATESGISIDRGIQDPDFFRGSVFFQNSNEVATGTLNEDSSGYDVRFKIGGEPDAVESFWEGVESKCNLGDLLLDDPELPQFINPLEFAVRELLGGSVVAIKVDSNKISNLNQFLVNLSNLRGGTSPVSLVILFIKFNEQTSIEIPEPSGAEVAVGMGIEVSEVSSNDFVQTRLTTRVTKSC